MTIFESLDEAKYELGPPTVKGEQRTVVVSTKDETGDTYPKYVRLTAIKQGIHLYWLTPEEQEKLHEQW